MSFINSIFTITSAVSVTGLTVVDTATHFTFFGQLVILIWIQLGGLGIMIFSYLTGFLIGRKATIEDKKALTLSLNEDDISGIQKFIKNMILITVMIESIGALMLFIGFYQEDSFSQRMFTSIFHSISAFCNAGFSIYTDSLIGFRSNLIVNLTICFLIITGGLSFSVLSNLFGNLYSYIRGIITGNKREFKTLTLNTSLVLIITPILIIGGMVFIYIMEHDNILLYHSIHEQYLESFFQSVTLRTAGFNTIDFSSLHSYTLLFMIGFMFIGGASGSTAGGVKVNTAGVIFAYFKSILQSSNRSIILKKSIPKALINKAFFLVLYSISIIFLCTLILLLTEKMDYIKLLFEAVSAFATVGLSTGITPLLSDAGKAVIIFLMFTGKIGPLTLLIALSNRAERSPIEYPVGNVNIG